MQQIQGLRTFAAFVAIVGHWGARMSSLILVISVFALQHLSSIRSPTELTYGSWCLTVFSGLYYNIR